MTSDYTQDVSFNSGFGALQTPVHMFTAALICGCAAPGIDKPFRYLDLACGNGLTLALLADAYPHGEFVGVDINPAHINEAKERANTASLKNVTFIESDITDLKPTDFDVFDYGALGGAYAWLDEGRRKAARDFVASVLRPGGLFYVDYSAQPGMAQTAPLYRLLQRLSAEEGGDSATRLTKAATKLDDLRKAGAVFFKKHPIAAARLESILRNPAEDEAHEVLNFQGYGLWSADVIEDFRGSGFSYAGNCGLHHNLPELSPSASMLKGHQSLPTPLSELFFDVAWDVAQRKDLYVKDGGGEVVLFLSQLAEMPVLAMPDALHKEQRANLAKRLPSSVLDGQVCDAIERVAPEARTFGDLVEELKRREFGDGAIEDALKQLLAMRLLTIGASFAGEAVLKGGGYRMISPLNAMLLEEDLNKEQARPFSSPVVGSRVLLPLKDRLYLAVLLGLPPEKAWAQLGRLSSLFRGANNEILSVGEFSGTVDRTLENFERVAAPELVRLGILGTVLV